MNYVKLSSAVVVGSLLLTSIAFAQGKSEDMKPTTTPKGVEHAAEKQNANATGSQATTTKGNAHSSTTPEKSQGEEHRSAVATFVQGLLALANRDGGIGDEVRAIAHEQASSSDRAVQAMANLEEEGFVKKIILGPDYKSLGDLRKDIVTTKNNISRLEKSKERTDDAATVADIDAQIEKLEELAASTEEYLKDHEEMFSVFGWFVKLFNE